MDLNSRDKAAPPEPMRRDNVGRSAAIAARKARRMQRRLEDLQRRYPKNSYSIVEKLDKRHGNTSSIVRDRTVGRRRHKISYKKR